MREDGGLAVVGVLGSGQEGEALSCDRVAKCFDGLTPRIGVELLAVSSREFVEFLGIVPVPLTQFRGWCDVLVPRVEIRLGLADPAGPDAVDQNTGPVVVASLFVDALDDDVHASRYTPGRKTENRAATWRRGAHLRLWASGALPTSGPASCQLNVIRPPSTVTLYWGNGLGAGPPCTEPSWMENVEEWHGQVMVVSCTVTEHPWWVHDEL